MPQAPQLCASSYWPVVELTKPSSTSPSQSSSRPLQASGGGSQSPSVPAAQLCVPAQTTPGADASVYWHGFSNEWVAPQSHEPEFATTHLSFTHSKPVGQVAPNTESAEQSRPQN